MDNLLWSLLGYVCLPLWLLAGLVDYWTHQRTDIARTSGLPEVVLHLTQMGQIGLPVLLVLFFEINAFALALIAMFVVAHTITAYWDIRYSGTRRTILPLEQLAHAFLITLPVFATAILVVLHWPEALELRNLSAVRLALILRDPPWDTGLIAVILVASVLFGALPALVEFRDTLRRRSAERI